MPVHVIAVELPRGGVNQTGASACVRAYDERSGGVVRILEHMDFRATGRDRGVDVIAAGDGVDDEAVELAEEEV